MRTGKLWVWAMILVVGVVATVGIAQTTRPSGSSDKPTLTRSPEEKPDGEGAKTKKSEPEGDKKEGDGERAGEEEAPEQGFFQKYFLFIMIGGFVLLYVVMGRGRRKRETRRKEMLASLKKGDKVTSIGGIVGTVIEVREDEVTVKVDETSNVRMKFARWAIRGVGTDAKKEGPGDTK